MASNLKSHRHGFSNTVAGDEGPLIMASPVAPFWTMRPGHMRTPHGKKLLMPGIEFAPDGPDFRVEAVKLPSCFFVNDAF